MLWDAQQLGFWIGNGTTNLDVGTENLVENTWYHVVATNDGVYSRIYLNGQFQDSILVGSRF